MWKSSNEKRRKFYYKLITEPKDRAHIIAIYENPEEDIILFNCYAELENRGYTAQDVSEIIIKHSYLNRILSYNEWIISVEFKKEPDVLFRFTYRNDKIIFEGVSSEPMLDKEEILDYSERFKNGTLLLE